jgi:hypothetical protein
MVNQCCINRRNIVAGVGVGVGARWLRATELLSMPEQVVLTEVRSKRRAAVGKTSRDERREGIEGVESVNGRVGRSQCIKCRSINGCNGSSRLPHRQYTR